MDGEKIWQLLKNSKKCIAFTGAGVSTLSGIPDFRGKNGLYRKDWHGLQLETVLSIDFFRQNPEPFYQWATEFVYRTEDFRPNIVHTTLGKLEKMGILKALYTQNIDNLHQRGGSVKCYELHGGASQHHCLKCHAAYSYDEIAPIVMQGKVPLCKTCGGVIKPDIVFYGEQLPEEVWAQAEIDFADADTVLVLGSSLTVYPAAYLPEMALRHGAGIILVNASATHLDDHAAILERDLDEVFRAISAFIDR